MLNYIRLRTSQEYKIRGCAKGIVKLEGYNSRHAVKEQMKN